MINNTRDLWVELSNTIDKVKKNKTFVTQAKEVNNSAGKMINLLRLQLEHARLVASQPKFNSLKLLQDATK
jgi:hypothetical protein